MRGTIDQNDKYVSKKGNVYELGDRNLIHLKATHEWGTHINEINTVRDLSRDDSNEAFEEHSASFVKFPTFKKNLKQDKNKEGFRKYLRRISRYLYVHGRCP